MQNFMTMAQEIMHLLSSKRVQHQPDEYLCIIPNAKTRTHQHDEPLPRISVDTLFCDHDGHSHLWLVKWIVTTINDRY